MSGLGQKEKFMKKNDFSNQPQNVLFITFDFFDAMNRTFQCLVHVLLIAMNRTFEAKKRTPAHVLFMTPTKNVMFCSSVHIYIYMNMSRTLC